MLGNKSEMKTSLCVNHDRNSSTELERIVV